MLAKLYGINYGYREDYILCTHSIADVGILQYFFIPFKKKVVAAPILLSVQCIRLYTEHSSNIYAIHNLHSVKQSIRTTSGI